MVNVGRLAALSARAYFFRAIPVIILDTHSVYHILCDLYLTKRRAFMMEQESLRNALDPAERLTHETLDQLKVYTIQTFASLAIFALFVAASIAADWLCGIYPQVRIMIMFKIVAWTMSVLGAICCTVLVVRNTIAFIKFLFKSPPQKTPGQEVADEGRDE